MKISIIIPVYNQEDLVKRAILSIPDLSNIEIIVINDGSVDKSLESVIETRKSFKNAKFVILNNDKNHGVSYTINRGYDKAKGEYIVLLGSDDYFYTDKFIEIIPLLNKHDLIYFNLQINDGTVWIIDKETTRNIFCGSVKFMKRDFIENTRCKEDLKAAEDYYFYKELLAKNPTELFTNITLKHYNFPREGSLSNLREKGQL